MSARDWYRIRNAAADVAEIEIYDEIGPPSPWGGDESATTSAKGFIGKLKDIKAKTINLRLNTPGGSVFDGTAIYNALRAHPAKVNVSIDGIAASIGSVIAMAGDKITIARNGYMMIHEASGLVLGTADDMRRTAAVMDKFDRTIAETYANRSGRPADEYREMMRNETWLTADEAVAAGLADEVDGAKDYLLHMAACMGRFQRVPGALSARLNTKGDAMPCRMPDGTMNEEATSSDACEAAGGTWEEPENAAETEEEEEKVEDKTKPAAKAKPVNKPKQPAAQAASLSELKAALPDSDAEFREQCMEANMTLTQATAKFAAKLAADNKKLADRVAKLEARKDGGQAVATIADTGDGGDPADALKAQWSSDADLRSEFGGRFDDFKAYSAAVADGRVTRASK